jgi:integrase
MHAALAVLLGLNGLRVSEACGANVEDLGFERGHRTLQIVGKGNKPAGVPLVPRTARTIDVAIGERYEGPILLRHDGARLDTRTAYRWVRVVGNHAGLDGVHPHMLRAAFSMAGPGRRGAAARRADCRPAADPSTTTAYDRRRQNYDRHAAYAVAFVTTADEPQAAPTRAGRAFRLGE